MAASTATGPSIGSDGTVYQVGGNLYAFDPETGAPNWTFTAERQHLHLARDRR